MANCKNYLPQEGTGLNEVGESLSASALSPSYSGGGNNRLEGSVLQPNDPCTKMDSDLKLREARVVLSRDALKEKSLPTGKLLSSNKYAVLDDDSPKMVILSDTDSDMSCRTAGSRASVSSREGSRFWRKRKTENEVCDSDEEQVSSPKAVAVMERRGRPPTTGKYVGLAKAKMEYVAAQRAAMELEAEREVAAMAQKVRSARPASKAGSPTCGESCDLLASATATDLSQNVKDWVAVIEKVATKSKNLKGTFQRELKDAASSIMEAVTALRQMSVTEETKRLQEANARLQKEVAENRKQLAELQEKVVQLSSRPAPSPPQAVTEAPALEELMRTIMLQVGSMLNARMEALEDRLLPEKRLRPPLAADRRNAAAMEIAEPEPVPGPSGIGGKTAMAAATKPKKGKGKKPIDSEPEPVQQNSRPLPAGPVPAVSEWVTVAKRGRKAAEGPRRDVNRGVGRPKGKSSSPKRQQAQKSASVPQTRPQNKAKSKAVKLRPPRTAAVVITLQPGAEEKGITYAKVIAEAKSRIDLGALEVPPLKMRVAATGARILEIPGAEKNSKADSLAVKLRELFEGTDDIRVSRPTVTADLRVSGLDDSVSSNELVEALAKAGGCLPTEVKAGEVRKGAAGMGSAFVRCPVAAAKKVASTGRLLVGWVAAQVRILDARPRRCYRCFALGHVRAQCKSEVDRSDECHRCGKKGHKASDCSAAPHCTLCAAADKAADHLSGGKACAKPPSKTRMKKKPAATKDVSQPASSGTEQVVRMEES